MNINKKYVPLGMVWLLAILIVFSTSCSLEKKSQKAAKKERPTKADKKLDKLTKKYPELLEKDTVIIDGGTTIITQIDTNAQKDYERRLAEIYEDFKRDVAIDSNCHKYVQFYIKQLEGQRAVVAKCSLDKPIKISRKVNTEYGALLLLATISMKDGKLVTDIKIDESQIILPRVTNKVNSKEELEAKFKQGYEKGAEEYYLKWQKANVWRKIGISLIVLLAAGGIGGGVARAYGKI